MEDFERELGSLSDLELGALDDINLDEINSFDAGNAEPSADAGAKPTVIQDALGGITTYVDIVFCIDVTRSMAPIINTVKNLTLDLYDDLVDNMRTANNRIVQQLRVKVIAFRDYYCDGPYAMEESDFFTLPKQKTEFRDFIASLEAKGGGDDPENALEAIALAMKSDWKRASNYNTERARNVVIVFTDASAHPLEKSADGVSEFYPADMVKNYSELHEAWCGQDTCMNASQYTMDPMAERLIIFAPEDAYPWNDIINDFARVAAVSIAEAKGGSDLGRDAIIAAISGSMR